MRVTVAQEPEGWVVWVEIDNEAPPDGCTFVVGMGATRDEAVDQACAEFQKALTDLLKHVLMDG